MKINDYYKNEYLTCGKTKDNFIFENCPNNFINFALQNLSIKANNVTPCNIHINHTHQLLLEKTLDLFEEDFHKKLIARDFVCTAIMINLMSNEPDNQELNLMKNGTSAILNQNFSGIKTYHAHCPMPHDITKIAKKQKIELNVFLTNITNKYLIQAINNFVSSREPYSVKIFANNSLCTYQDQLGNRIECPHDYISLSPQNFIEMGK